MNSPFSYHSTAMLRLLLALAFILAPLVAQAEQGKASWYGPGFNGHRTACGQKFNQMAMTAAHKTLPCGTRVMVRMGGRSIIVRINDRGPFVRGRIIDLSKGAARALGMSGVASVTVTVIR